MTRYFLRRVSIEGFRGINNPGDPLILDFKLDAINSIHAANAAGKSSIYEAVHFAICGTVPRLNELQEAEDRESYIVNRFHPTGSATVEMVFAPDDRSPDVTILVLRDPTHARLATSPSGHPDPEGFLAALREDFVLVDYRKFAGFIDATALLRGRSFASLVGLSRYSSMRQCLEGAKDTQNFNNDFGLAMLEAMLSANRAASNSAKQQIVAAHAEATGSEANTSTPLGEMVTRVTETLRGIAILQPLVADKAVTQMDFAAAEKAVEAEEGGELRSKLERLRVGVAELKLLAVSDDEQQGVQTLQELARRRDEAVARVGTSDLLELYHAASRVIASTDWPDPALCPVCEEQSPSSILERLAAQIALYDEAAQLDRQLSQAVGSSTSVSKLAQLEGSEHLSVAATDRLASSLIRDSAEQTIATERLATLGARLSELNTLRLEVLSRLEEQIAEVEATLPASLVNVTRILSSAKQFCEAARRYIDSLPTIADQEARLAAIMRWKMFIGRACDIFADAETKLTGARIASIQSDFQTLFAKIMRGGQNVCPTLTRSSSREQVDLRLDDFFGLRGVNARALLSESYRNAVAAAIFLSAAVRHSGSPRFMILDDITSSFDAGHQVALMEAMRTDLSFGANPDGLQFILLSHDTTLEKYFDRLNGTSDWHHQKLQGMSPQGKVLVAAQQADRLKAQAQQFLSAGQVDVGAAFIRQYLEYKLGFIIAQLAIPMPPDYSTRGDRRTLSTYLDGMVGAVELYSRAGTCVLTQQQIQDLTGRHAPSIVANFVSHYETGAGSPFGASALLGVIQSVDDLAGCFQFTDASLNPPTRYYRRLNRRT